jgi:N-acetylmuramoyl-L-alanine amidase
VYELSDPLRLVIDLEQAEFRGELPPVNTIGPYVQRIRKGIPQPGVLRFVLDLKHRVASEVIVLPPNEIYGHRLVIDIGDSRARSVTPALPEPVSPEPARAAPVVPVVIAIDAGHGGEDPGAVGASRTLEKHVVLAIARRLKDRIDRHPAMVARLIRDGDYYISLRERTRLAREHNADLFISLHADGFYDRSARGMSVYALSNQGATSEAARWLANKENASDLVGGITLRDKDDLLAQVLLDLSMTRTVSDGIAFARFVLGQLRQLGPVHSRRVEQAGFAVLKSPDIPSILVETGYITNPREEKFLRTSDYQLRVAEAIYRGVVNYLEVLEMLPTEPTPVSDDRVHLVSSGDNLSILATRYGVSVTALKRINGLSDNRIYVGQRLRIPAQGG